MEKRTRYYTLKPGVPDSWPEELMSAFRAHLCRFGIMFFDEGSARETEFLCEARNRGLRLDMRSILYCTGPDLFEHPYHYLTVKQDRVHAVGELMDLSTSCSRGEKPFCLTGATQRRRISINPRKSLKLDMMEEPRWIRPRLYIISRRMRDLMEPQGFTGYRLEPCLQEGGEYTPCETLFRSQSPALEERAVNFQLRITAKTLGPPRVGEIKRFQPPCPRCGVERGFISNSAPVFSLSDLNCSDFQISDEQLSDNYGIVKTPGEICIVSARFLRFLLDNGIQGLRDYLTDPPIPFGVVDIK